MNILRNRGCRPWLAMLGLASVLPTVGCGPSFEELRLWGQQAVARQDFGVAYNIFEEAYTKIPEHPENLHDLGVCATMVARNRFDIVNPTAGMREADRAINYYSRAINAYPGFRSAVVGKTRAQELKGQFEEALRTAHWGSKFTGPSADQQIFLAEEYERRGDMDAALLRLRQGVAMEPDNPAAHKALGLFYKRLGDPSAAAAALRESLRLDPNQPDVVSVLQTLGESPR